MKLVIVCLVHLLLVIYTSGYDLSKNAYAKIIVRRPTPYLTTQPLVLRQGDVLIINAKLRDAVRVIGRCGSHPLQFHPQKAVTVTQPTNTGFVALVGLDALLPSGSYSLTVLAYDAYGGYDQKELTVKVLPRYRVMENVRLSPALSPTLNPSVNVDETAQIASIYNAYTDRRLWTGPLRWPVRGALTSTYGNRRSYNGIDLGTYHGGYDISAGSGTPVRPAAPGQVVTVNQFVVRGLTIVLDHGDGVFTSYSHLSKAFVTAGQMITDTSQAIGAVGSTGRSQGPHLHLELAVGGTTVDPGPWLRVALP